MLSIALKDVAIVMHFSLNQAEIASRHCVNLYVPETTCHGKCYLIKQLKESDQENEQVPLKRMVDRLEFKFVSEMFHVSFKLTNDFGQKDDLNPLSRSKHYSQNHTTRVFHPPQALNDIILS